MSAPEDHFTREDMPHHLVGAASPFTGAQQVDCLAFGAFAERIGKTAPGRALLGAFCLNLVKTMGAKILTREQLKELRDHTTRAIGEPL